MHKPNFLLDGITLTPHPGIHFKYGDEFLPPCLRTQPPEVYVGKMFSSTPVAVDVTCRDCKEWMHA